MRTMYAEHANRTPNTGATTTRRRPAAALLAMVLLAVAAAGCMPAQEKTFLDRTNALRSQYGVPRLYEHPNLTNKAEAWAQHMARTGTLAHSTLSANLGSLNWKSLGENVGYSSPTKDTLLTIHNMFVNSPGHRKNLLNSGFTHMGVGVAKDSKGRIWVAEVFARL
jgi:uncharacterized protein YkwD